ncbi:MAG: FliA/WhiG family RNA polymerase sigma factor [Polyangiaceae bacterium]
MNQVSESSGSVGRRVLTREDYERYLPLVRRIAMRVARKVPAHITVPDLVSYGWLGLLEAYARSSATMPAEEFEAYASYRVRGAILDHLRSLDPTARDLRTRSRVISRTLATLTRELGRPPEEEEVAARLGVKVEALREDLAKIAEAGLARLEMVDLDDAHVEGSFERPDDEAARRDLVGAVTDAIPRLPDRLQKVLALYYQEECTLREIGAVLGVSESRVCQLHSEAIHRIRAAVGRE